MTTPKRPYQDDPDAPPSEDERAGAESLRAALEDPGRPHEGADLARAVALAYAPREIDRQHHGDLVEKALVARDSVTTKGPAVPGARRSAVVIRVVFGAAGALSLAAGVLVLLRTSADRDVVPAAAVAQLVPVRSTQPLFHEPFVQRGAGSARIDRIAMARAGDLRENEFRRWGVR